jgi:hypothetical protein
VAVRPFCRKECKYIDIKRRRSDEWWNAKLLLLVLFQSENEPPIVHIACLQNDFKISNEALRSVERKEKDRIQEKRDG